MLQVSYIREHRSEVIERLSKRTKEAATLIAAVLELDWGLILLVTID